MVCATFTRKNSVIRSVDCRVRVAAAFALSLLVASCGSKLVAAVALAAGGGLAVLARLPLKPLSRRLLWFNVLMLCAAVSLCFMGEGGGLELWGLRLSRSGAELAALVALKGNALMFIFMALVSTMEPSCLGVALQGLGLPRKLAVMLLLSVRYTDLIHHEYERLRDSMRVRCFRLRFNFHTFASLGNMFGMLLVKSMDRSDRIVRAMKCRAFRGTFHSLGGLNRFGRREAAFSLFFIVLSVVLLFLEFSQ